MEEAKRVMEPHEKVSRRGQQWFLLLLLPPLVWGIVFACYPLVAEQIRPQIIFNLVEGLKPLGLPLYAALAVAFLITVLYPRTLQGKSLFSRLRHEKGSKLLRQGAIACWVLGYGNLLFGVIPSVIGTIAPFFVGMVLYVVRAIRLGERPLWQPRGYILAIGIFLLYDLCTLLWSPNRAVSLEWWIREASLLPSIFLLLMYPPHPRDIRVFMHYALRISYLYLLSIVAIYVVVCWATDTSLGAAFGLEKMYFVFNGTPMGTLFLGSLFGFQHYTYLGFIMLAPILYWLLERERLPEVRNLLVGSLVGFLLFVFIFQSRILMLVLCGAFSLGLLYLFASLVFPQKGAYKKRILLLLPIIAVASLLLFLCYPSALKYLIDEHRLNLFETAIMYLKENPLWGYGLGSAEALISPFYQGEYATHFHNQYLLCYVEGGIMSLLLWVVIFISYLRYALRSRNYAALIYVVIMLVVMLIEVITCLSQYLIAMSLMAAFLISTHPYLQKK